MISQLNVAMHFIVPGSLPKLSYFSLMERNSPSESQVQEFQALVRRAAPNIEHLVPYLCDSVWHDVFTPIIVEVPLSCSRCLDLISNRCYACLSNICEECGDPYCDYCILHICIEEECRKRGE